MGGGLPGVHEALTPASSFPCDRVDRERGPRGPLRETGPKRGGACGPDPPNCQRNTRASASGLARQRRTKREVTTVKVREALHLPRNPPYGGASSLAHTASSVVGIASQEVISASAYLLILSLAGRGGGDSSPLGLRLSSLSAPCLPRGLRSEQGTQSPL